MHFRADYADDFCRSQEPGCALPVWRRTRVFAMRLYCFHGTGGNRALRSGNGNYRRAAFQGFDQDWQGSEENKRSSIGQGASTHAHNGIVDGMDWVDKSAAATRLWSNIPAEHAGFSHSGFPQMT